MLIFSTWIAGASGTVGLTLGDALNSTSEGASSVSGLMIAAAFLAGGAQLGALGCAT